MGPLAGAAVAALALLLLLREALKWHTIVRRLLCARGLPGPPVPHWLLGHTPDLLARSGRTFRLFEEWDRAYGPVYTIRFLWNALVVVTDPDVFGPLLRPGPRHLEKNLVPYKRLEHLIHPPTPSMLTRPEDAHWRLVRRAVAPAFQTANLRGAFAPMVAAIARVVGALSPYASSGQPFDMDDVAQRLTIDVIGEFGFGRDFGGHRLGCGQESLDAVRALTEAMQALNNPLARWMPWSQPQRALRHWGARLHRLVDSLLADLEASPPPPHTLAAHVMAIRDAEGRPLSRLQMISELALLWGAGFETTAHTLTWAVFLISTHPEVEAAVLDELGDLAAGPGRPQPRPLEWADLGRLRHLSAAIQEAMRLYPAVSTGTARVTHAPTDVGGFQLPAGMPILISTWAVHRSPRLWLRPDDFLPFERWLVPDGSADVGGDVALGGADEDSGGGGGGGGRPSSSNGGPAGDRAKAAGAGGGSSGGAAPRRPPSRSSGGGGGAAAAISGPALAQPSALMTFSQGTRSCVGQGLAVLELKAALALLLGSLSFDLAPGWTPQDVAASAAQAITLRPGRGLWLVATPREALPGGRRAAVAAGGA